MRYAADSSLGTNRCVQYGGTWKVPTRSPSVDLRMHTSSAGDVADGIQCMLILSDMHWENKPKVYIGIMDNLHSGMRPRSYDR